MGGAGSEPSDSLGGAKVMAKEKASVRTSMLSRSVWMFSIRAPPVTALITLCKPVTMADN